MRDQLATYDGVGQAELVKRGEVTPLELVEAAIARIEALDPTLHALAYTDFDRARAQAATAPDGPLRGVPFLLKDLLPYPGLRCAMGSRLFAQHVPQEPSPYSERIDASGLIVLGKTTTSELGMLGSTETLLEGVTHNPWSRGRSAMGSSGGAAAAVASGMVPFAHASDGGGSIRIPASANGLFGLKPSRDRCVSVGQIHPLFAPLLSEHCVSRSVRDSALFLSLTERRDDAAPHRPVGYVSEPIQRPLRLHVYTNTLMGEAPSPDVQQALDKTVALCRELGHDVREVAAPDLDGPALSTAFFTLAGAANADMIAMIEPMIGTTIGPAHLEPFTLALHEWFQGLPPGAVEAQTAVLANAEATMREALAQCDAMLCPTMPVVPPELGFLAPTLPRETLLRRTEQIAGYTPVHNMAGVPAMSVPLFWSEDGLPIGSHFAARAGGEATLLGLAYQLEEAAPWRDRWPRVDS